MMPSRTIAQAIVLLGEPRLFLFHRHLVGGLVEVEGQDRGGPAGGERLGRTGVRGRPDFHHPSARRRQGPTLRVAHAQAGDGADRDDHPLDLGAGVDEKLARRGLDRPKPGEDLDGAAEHRPGGLGLAGKIEGRGLGHGDAVPLQRQPGLADDGVEGLERLGRALGRALARLEFIGQGVGPAAELQDPGGQAGQFPLHPGGLSVPVRLHPAQTLAQLARLVFEKGVFFFIGRGEPGFRVVGGRRSRRRLALAAGGEGRQDKRKKHGQHQNAGQ